MADCSDIFISFNSNISLTKTAIRNLRAARSAIKRKIIQYFSESIKPLQFEFFGQGSFTFGTIIRPLNGEYDIDIGIYIKDQSKWRDEWPTPESISERIKSALIGHTSYNPINKRKCVRIIYRSTQASNNLSYHVDLPIYIKYKNFFGEEITRIGINGPIQWSQKSNPKGLTNWFIQQCLINKSDKEQLIRLVKYIKAWKDFKSDGTKFPSGIALTVLMSENYSPHERDDIAFKETTRKAYNKLFMWYDLLGMKNIYNPVLPDSILTDNLTKTQKEYFRQCFEQLVDDAKIAIDEPDYAKSLQLWQGHLGTRFC